MSVWTVVLVVVAAWCTVSVPVAVLLGHAIAGRRLRAPSLPQREVQPSRPLLDKAS